MTLRRIFSNLRDLIKKRNKEILLQEEDRKSSNSNVYITRVTFGNMGKVKKKL